MRRPASLPHAVMSEIPELFARLGFKAGDRLPAERDLAKQLSVGRSSLREAIQGLAAMGVVERRQGVGTFFLAEPGTWSTAPLKVPARSPVTLFEELIETRILLEVRLASLAAERATAADLTQIRSAAGKRARAADGEYAQLGLDFHAAIAAAAHQSVLSEMLNAVRVLYSDTWNSLDAAARHAVLAFRARQQAGHMRILRAIEARNAAGAARAMRRHLIELQNEFSSIHEPSKSTH